MAWLMAYLASPAGDFFSGCVLTLDGARDNWFGQLAARAAPPARGASRSPRSAARTRRQRRRPLTILKERAGTVAGGTRSLRSTSR